MKNARCGAAVVSTWRCARRDGHFCDVQDISRRLGNLREGAKDIKNHAFFQEVDWANPYHLRGSIRPPAFQRSDFEWVGADRVVLEDTKQMTEADQRLFKDL